METETEFIMNFRKLSNVKDNFELSNLQYSKLNFTFTLVMDYMFASVLFVYEKQTLDKKSKQCD